MRPIGRRGLFIIAVVMLLVPAAVKGRRPAAAGLPPVVPTPAALRCDPHWTSSPPVPVGGRADARLATDREVYAPGEPVHAVHSLTNPTDIPALVSTSRVANWIARSVPEGTIVYSSYPPGPIPLPAPRPCVLDPGVTVTTAFDWNQRTGNQFRQGEQVPPGLYEIEGADLGPPRAVARFEIAVPPAAPTPEPTRCPGGAYCPGACPAGERPVSVVACVPAAYESVPLSPGCNAVVSTFPDGTPLPAVARTVMQGTPLAPYPPPDAIWRYDNAARRFLGWSPRPNAPNDIDQVDDGDPLVICIGGPGAFFRPPA